MAEDTQIVNSENSQLWDAFRDGDQGAYEKIFTDNYTLLLNYGLKLQPDREEVKECIQILFTNLWRSRTRIGSSTSIRNYLVASLRRLILKRAKKVIPFVGLESIHPVFRLELSPEAKIIADHDEKAKIDALQKAVLELPERQKEAIFLKYYGNHSFAEIADIMQISVRTAYKLVYKALDKLEATLSYSRKDILRLLCYAL